MEGQIIRTEYSEVMQKSYIDYAMSVIVSRALPDVRDGLKPVQRRTLYDMYELGIRYDRPYRKCARIVGDTMGKYHPHGDSSIYDALVVMAQDFKKGQALVDGHGNFGSIEGDGAAAMRYTEARLEKITQEVYLSDMDKNVVDFMPNFDETEKEPVVLPVRVPNLLLNGADGIAVGMATSIPPHNLAEIVDGVKAYMKNNEITVKGLMRYSVEQAKANEIPLKFWNPLQKGETIEADGKVYTPDMVLGPARKGLKVTYCTDSRPTVSMEEHAKESDLLICEGMYGEPEKDAKAREYKHMTMKEAAKLAKKAQVKEMWLTHFSPSLVHPEEYMDGVREIFPNSYVGKDGKSVDLLFEEEENE